MMDTTMRDALAEYLVKHYKYACGIDIQFAKRDFSAGYSVASARIAELERICAESYQVLGQFIDQLPDAKALDNLSQARLVHDDVLPCHTKHYAFVEALEKASEWFEHIEICVWADEMTRQQKLDACDQLAEIARAYIAKLLQTKLSTADSEGLLTTLTNGRE